MNVAVVNFSGRMNGNCHDISREIKNALGNCGVTIIDMGHMDIRPCGRCNYECLDAQNACPVKDDIGGIYETLCAASLIFYVVPNYINYPCANFFVFNERKQGVFGRNAELLQKYLEIPKGFVVVSNTEKDNFRQIFKGHAASPPDILFMATRDFDSNVRGGMMKNANARKKLRGFLETRDQRPETGK